MKDAEQADSDGDEDGGDSDDDNGGGVPHNEGDVSDDNIDSNDKAAMCDKEIVTSREPAEPTVSPEGVTEIGWVVLHIASYSMR